MLNNIPHPSGLAGLGKSEHGCRSRLVTRVQFVGHRGKREERGGHEMRTNSTGPDGRTFLNANICDTE